MSTRQRRRWMRAGALAAAALSLTLYGCGGDDDSSEAGSDEPVTLTWFQGAGVEANIQTAQALADAFMAENPDITIEVDASGPGGVELDNVMKTRLATGEMSDIFWYNSGSLLQAVNPDQTMLNVADADFIDNLSEDYVATVSTENGVYGVPVGAALGGGIFYNIPIYEELGLEIPTSWDEFMANNQAIKDAGYTAVAQTYGDTWTSQMLMLADYYNVHASDSEWAEKYTANEVKYATDPVAVRGFEKLQELHDGGFFNEDFASALLDDGLRMVATGEAAHYPMLTFAVATIIANHPDNVEDVGFFPVPGDSSDSNGLTTWMPSSLYAPADTPHPEAVQEFMAFVASPAGCDAITEAIGVTGPYLIEGCTLPDDAPRGIADMLPYFDAGDTAPALEFLSPVKGPALQQLTVEVGSGIRDAHEAAQLYDEDAEKQAQQLGLPGWS